MLKRNVKSKKNFSKMLNPVMAKRKNFSNDNWVDDKQMALALCLDNTDYDDIDENDNGHYVLENGKEYVVYTDKEADEAYQESILDLIDEVGFYNAFPDYIKDTILYHMIDWNQVCKYLQNGNGRGNELARYDGEELEQEYDNQMYYIYRVE